MITGMNSPAVYQGNVVEPSHISQPHSYAARDFFNTIRDLLHKSGYHNESDLLSALGTVDDYEKHVVGADQAHVVSEFDRAPVEDVSQRVPPQSGLPVLAPAQQIDYARLAAAIVAAQAAQRPDTHNVTPPGQVPDISSMPQQPQVTATPEAMSTYGANFSAITTATSSTNARADPDYPARIPGT